MLRYLVAYVASAVVFVAMDFGWLSFAANRIYRPAMGDMLASKAALVPALLFYLLYVAGMQILAVAPALKTGSPSRAVLTAAILGLVAYGTYDLTNQATLRNWSTRLTLIDMGWGVIVTGAAAAAGFYAARALRSE